MMGILPRYPVYVISKGRHDTNLTAKFLINDGVPFSLVIEPQEYDLYAQALGTKHLVVLPFNNLGLGSIPARNWVKEHATQTGAKRHWILDDNIYNIFRRYKTRRIVCPAGPALAACEDFTDRYENIAIAGLNYRHFVMNAMKFPPFYLNHHVYSCILILNELPNKWRGRYNEDTDLCLQVLADGWCTVLFNVFLINKMTTMTMKGGNSTELYKGDGRLKMANALKRLWPGVVETKRRWGRPQHVVKNIWRSFDTPLKRRADIDFDKLQPNEYGLTLTQTGDTKAESLKKVIKEARAKVDKKSQPIKRNRRTK